MVPCTRVLGGDWAKAGRRRERSASMWHMCPAAVRFTQGEHQRGPPWVESEACRGGRIEGGAARCDVASSCRCKAGTALSSHRRLLRARDEMGSWQERRWRISSAAGAMPPLQPRKLSPSLLAVPGRLSGPRQEHSRKADVLEEEAREHRDLEDIAQVPRQGPRPRDRTAKAGERPGGLGDPARSRPGCGEEDTPRGRARVWARAWASRTQGPCRCLSA